MGTTASPAQDGQTIDGKIRTSTIHRMAEERLRDSGYLALRDVVCMAHQDMVSLHGRLPSYFLKQLAQEIAAGVEGVRRVINRIEVLRPGRPGMGALAERSCPPGELSFTDTPRMKGIRNHAGPEPQAE